MCYHSHIIFILFKKLIVYYTPIKCMSNKFKKLNFLWKMRFFKICWNLITIFSISSLVNKFNFNLYALIPKPSMSHECLEKLSLNYLIQYFNILTFLASLICQQKCPDTVLLDHQVCSLCCFSFFFLHNSWDNICQSYSGLHNDHTILTCRIYCMWEMLRHQTVLEESNI
jgi:hypothetical protein